MKRREFLLKSSLIPLLVPLTVTESKSLTVKPIESPDIIYEVCAGSLPELAKYIEDEFLIFINAFDALIEKDKYGVSIPMWFRVHEAKSKTGTAFAPIKVNYKTTGIDTRLTSRVINNIVTHCKKEKYISVSKIKCLVELDRDILKFEDIIAFMCEIEGSKRS